MSFLLDTNLISELRKGQKCATSVWRWRQSVALEEIYISVLVLGELRRGVENIRRRDAFTAQVLEKWLREVETVYDKRILPVTAGICDLWGRLSIRAPLPPVDGLLAATALVHDLTLVTRNTVDVKRSGARCLDPFVTRT
jgi:predicted nucleic acid-binding protein